MGHRTAAAALAPVAITTLSAVSALVVGIGVRSLIGWQLGRRAQPEESDLSDLALTDAEVDASRT